MTEQPNDHEKTIEMARDLLGKVTPGWWNWSEYPSVLRIGDTWNTVAHANRDDVHVSNPADAEAIAVVPDLLAALDAVARERDALRERVRELEVKMYVSNLMTDARARKSTLEEVIEWLKANKGANP